jgi:GNAT superfamily N-acetyltransferase
VCVRAVRPGDRELLQTAFARLSPRSVYQRFFHPVNALTADDLRRVTEVDFHNHVGIVLTVGAGNGERLIADGRYVRVVSGGDVAEVAFTVLDAYQNRGAATLLLRELTAVARARGIRKFIAFVLNDNRQMLELFRRSGFALQDSVVDGVQRLVLTLGVAGGGSAPRHPLRLPLLDAIRTQWRRFAGGKRVSVDVELARIPNGERQ